MPSVLFLRFQYILLQESLGLVTARFTPGSRSLVPPINRQDSSRTTSGLSPDQMEGPTKAFGPNSIVKSNRPFPGLRLEEVRKHKACFKYLLDVLPQHAPVAIIPLLGWQKKYINIHNSVLLRNLSYQWYLLATVRNRNPTEFSESPNEKLYKSV